LNSIVIGRGVTAMDKNQNENIPSRKEINPVAKNAPNTIDWDLTITNARHIIDGVNQLKPILENIGPLLARIKGKSAKTKNRKRRKKG
jgi:hypothetical protein